MNAQTPRRFAALDGMEARSKAMLPLLIGLAGPSGSGKTYSALRLATGIQSVVGGDIFVIDTEQRRALHYADTFRFKHVPFEAPFGSLDYLEALRFAKKQGAGVAIIDSCSHEHDGPGGLLEQHEAELDRMAGDNWQKRQTMAMLAWQKPKAGRRKLVAALTSELDLPAIFCFRAKTTTKPVKDDRGKVQPVDMGFTTIGADEWLFEMALSCLLLPGSNGCPTWSSDKPGERLAIKVPRQFRHLSEPPPRPLDEAVGAMLARWAKGEPTAAARAPASTDRFAAHDAAPSRSPDAYDPRLHASETPQHDAGPGAASNGGEPTPRQKAEDWTARAMAKIGAVEFGTDLEFLLLDMRDAVNRLEKAHPDLFERLQLYTDSRRRALDSQAQDDVAFDEEPADA